MFGFLKTLFRRKVKMEEKEPQDRSPWKKIDRYFKHKHAVVAVEEADTFLYVVLIKVHKDSRGKGIGSAIMKRIVWYAKRYKKDIVLEAMDIDGSDIGTLKSFYKKFGFKEGKVSRIAHRHDMYFQAYENGKTL